MKTTLLTFLAFIIGLSCFGQEIELKSSLSTSSEQRFQGSYGIGLQYQNNIGHKFKIGFGFHYNFNNSQFDYIPYVDANPEIIAAQKINSNSKRFSPRLNIQWLVRDNENVSISLGPEVSYNLIWGLDKIDERLNQYPSHYIFSQKLALTKDFGLGIISKIEIKKVLLPDLSLCFTIRPEILIAKNILVFGTDPRPFSKSMALTEFQIGLNYRFK